ncbi:hypothetical protein HK099_008643 [Clydaea vesicula]|uniref:Uncharacterized protein n=1 Tax=Clydaea vesicula TaxID=447962 RepID=A0AAD5TVT6_9FUNG|nr:hypothetical protein HK099_008643 [Clydaea vesicula]KAJ3397710.1 hypothetical protein HDU92_004126 [Lobulomyces angularis]
MNLKFSNSFTWSPTKGLQYKGLNRKSKKEIEDILFNNHLHPSESTNKLKNNKRIKVTAKLLKSQLALYDLKFSGNYNELFTRLKRCFLEGKLNSIPNSSKYLELKLKNEFLEKKKEKFTEFQECAELTHIFSKKLKNETNFIKDDEKDYLKRSSC